MSDAELVIGVVAANALFLILALGLAWLVFVRGRDSE